MATVDLVTVAQALHWFDLTSFYQEVSEWRGRAEFSRCGVTRSSMSRPRSTRLSTAFMRGIVGDYWPPERRIVEEGYQTLPFPFEELTAPEFQMVHSWNLEHLMGYFASWSSTQRYRKQTGADPLVLIADDLKAAWGDPERTRDVVWPVSLRVGRACR